MPHFIVEVSDNLVEDIDPSVFLRGLHTTLASSGPFPLDQMKGRVVTHSKYLVSDGSSPSAFVHVTVLVLEGRSPEVRREAGAQLIEFLNGFFKQSRSELKCAITLELREMPRDTYFRSDP
jgi:5-carboxymethyl-2-hydroxymuconate isomerase